MRWSHWEEMMIARDGMPIAELLVCLSRTVACFSRKQITSGSVMTPA